jgi:hypothetical protein
LKSKTTSNIYFNSFLNFKADSGDDGATGSNLKRKLIEEESIFDKKSSTSPSSSSKKKGEMNKQNQQMNNLRQKLNRSLQEKRLSNNNFQPDSLLFNCAKIDRNQSKLTPKTMIVNKKVNTTEKATTTTVALVSNDYADTSDSD